MDTGRQATGLKTYRVRGLPDHANRIVDAVRVRGEAWERMINAIEQNDSALGEQINLKKPEAKRLAAEITKAAGNGYAHPYRPARRSYIPSGPHWIRTPKGNANRGEEK